MTTIPDLIRLYTKGFKQLFYHRGEIGEREKLSLLKIILFFLYLSAYLFAFLQFTDRYISNASIQMYRDLSVSLDTYFLMFPLTIYGELALLINMLILLGVFYFIFTGDKPLTIKRLKDRSSQIYGEIYEIFARNRGKILVVGIFSSFISIQIIRGDIGVLGLIEPENFIGGFFFNVIYWISKLSIIIWVLISPFLVVGAVIVSLDIFAKDYPKFMEGFNKKLVLFFCIFLIFSLFGGFTLVNFLGRIDSTDPLWSDPPIPVHSSSDILYYKIGLYWILQGISITLYVFFFLISISAIVIIKKRGSNDIRSSELRDRRTAIILFIFPFILIYVLLKALPYVFTFGPRLKSLNNLIDFVSLVLLIIFAIFRVLAIQEEEGKTKKGLDLIPPYSKALFLLFLAFSSFYASIEANTILFLYNIQNEFRQLRIAVSLGLLAIWIPYIFWRYKPLAGTLTHETKL